MGGDSPPPPPHTHTLPTIMSSRVEMHMQRELCSSDKIWKIIQINIQSTIFRELHSQKHSENYV